MYPDGPAEKAGLKTKDLIIAINGDTADSALTWDRLLLRIWYRARPGDKVVLTIQRPGHAQPLAITPAFRAMLGAGDTKTVAYTLAQQIMNSYPVFFAIVGFAVLFLRVEDRHAWLLALMFATWITAGPMPSEFCLAPYRLQTLLLTYRTITSSLLDGLFYFFFAVFPKRSPIDRKVPWLKWAFLVVDVGLGYGGIRNGNQEALPFVTAVLPHRVVQGMDEVIGYGALLLGVLSLLLNFLHASDAADRRKLKVVLWGTAIGVPPVVALYAVTDNLHVNPPFWLTFVCIFLMLLFPLSFAYAVVKHRVMDIPVLLQAQRTLFRGGARLCLSHSG